MMSKDTCPCCGQMVSVSTADEGTSSFVGEEYNAAIEDAARAVEEKAKSQWFTDTEAVKAIRALKKEGK